jgi:hypothetical protein
MNGRTARRSLARLLARWASFAALASVLLSVALLWSAPARADGAESGDAPPRDEILVMQPAAAKVPPLPVDFIQLDRAWIELDVPSSVRERGEALLREADEFRSHLAEDFGQPVLYHVLVRVGRSPEQMVALAPEGVQVPDYAAGVAYPALHTVLLTLQAPDTWEAPDLGEVLKHELSHVALSEAVAFHHVPRWFDEGVAIRESGESPYLRTKALWDATVGRRLLPLADLDRGFPSDHYEVTEAYAESADFVRFLMRDADRARFGSLLQKARSGVPFDRTLEDAYGVDIRKLEFQWREELSRRFGIIPTLTGGGLLWIAVSGLAMAAWLKKRRRAKAKLAEWAQEEAAADAATATARASHEPSIPPPAGDENVPSSRVPSIPVVEHDGRWHTLH